MLPTEVGMNRLPSVVVLLGLFAPHESEDELARRLHPADFLFAPHRRGDEPLGNFL